MGFEKILSDIRSILTKHKLAFIIILLAIFLRFYNLYDFVTFLGDQGRDAIIIKRIVTFEHFPLIGAPSSVGQIYLGPFYYYLISPFLLIFKLNPISLAWAVAFFSTVGLVFAYIVLKKATSEKIALLFLFFATFSYPILYLSRFSWNPNLLPLFAFATLYYLYKFLTKKTTLHSLALGASLALSLQLHYLAALILPTIAFFILKDLFQKGFKKHFSKLLPAIFSFIFFISPLIFFDLKHGFLNTNNVIKLFTQNNPIGNISVLSRFIDTSSHFFNFVFQSAINPITSMLLLIGIFVYFLKNKLLSKDSFMQINFFNFFSYLLFFALLNSPRHIHYYGPVYFSFFIIASTIAAKLLDYKFIGKIIFSLLLIIYFVYNGKNYGFVFNQSKSQITIAQNIAQSIIEKKPAKPLQMVALPASETDGHIRYFLEINGFTPLPQDSIVNPKELYVVCPNKCDPLNDGQWQIAAFKNAKIADIWESEGITIYQIIHEK